MGRARSAILALLGLATPLAASVGARAAEDSSFGYSWTVSAANDYIFRGISFTQNDPTVNSYLEFTYKNAYLAFFTTNIDTCEGDGCLGPVEQDIYLGYRTTTGPISWDAAVWYYLYKVKGSTYGTTDLDYVEFKIGATVTPVNKLTVTANAYYQPEQGVAAVDSWGMDGTAAYELPSWGIFTPSLSGTIGFADSGTSKYFPNGFWLSDDFYTYWNAGLKLAIDHMSFDFRYWGTDIDSVDPANNKLADDRFIFTVSVSMP